MCFSATASFSASSLLLLMGGYASFKALKNDRRFIFLALIPIIFAFQQAFEGAVWLAPQQKFFSLSYLFFAYFFWPFFISFGLYYAEKDVKKKKYLILLAILSIMVGLSIYLPLLINPQSLNTTIINHSICYSNDFSTLHTNILSLLYISVMLSSIWISSLHYSNLTGILLLLSFILADIFYHYAFTSIWCFLGAMLSFFIIFLIPQNDKFSKKFKIFRKN